MAEEGITTAAPLDLQWRSRIGVFLRPVLGWLVIGGPLLTVIMWYSPADYGASASGVVVALVIAVASGLVRGLSEWIKAPRTTSHARTPALLIGRIEPSPWGR